MAIPKPPWRLNGSTDNVLNVANNVFAIEKTVTEERKNVRTAKVLNVAIEGRRHSRAYITTKKLKKMILMGGPEAKRMVGPILV